MDKLSYIKDNKHKLNTIITITALVLFSYFINYIISNALGPSEGFGSEKGLWAFIIIMNTVCAAVVYLGSNVIFELLFYYKCRPYKWLQDGSVIDIYREDFMAGMEYLCRVKINYSLYRACNRKWKFYITTLGDCDGHKGIEAGCTGWLGDGNREDGNGKWKKELFLQDSGGRKIDIGGGISSPPIVFQDIPAVVYIRDYIE